jgi:plastocyanin
MAQLFVRARWIAVSVGLLACGGGDGSAPTGPGAGIVITLTAGSRFSPNDLTVNPGTVVRWSSATSTFHTITPDNPQQPGVWNRTESASTGTVLTHTFNVSGQTYTYHCETHLAEGMIGTIRVR